jgi:hypothetical protein
MGAKFRDFNAILFGPPSDDRFASIYRDCDVDDVFSGRRHLAEDDIFLRRPWAATDPARHFFAFNSSSTSRPSEVFRAS